MVETAGQQRLSGTHNKALNNDETNGCARRVHFTKFIIQIFEYHPYDCNNAVLVGPLKHHSKDDKALIISIIEALLRLRGLYIGEE